MQYLTNEDIENLNIRLAAERDEQNKIMRAAIRDHIAYIARRINSATSFPIEVTDEMLNTTSHRFNLAEFNDIKEYFENFSISLRTETIPDLPCYYYIITIQPIYPIKGNENK